MFKRIIFTAAIVSALVVVMAPAAMAQGVTPGQIVDYAQLLPAALTLMLPIGLILLISSAMPEDKAPATAINLLMVWAVAALAYFVMGFAFNFGGIAQVSSNPELRGLYWEWYPLDQSVDVDVARLWGIVALRGWLLTGEASTAGALTLFLSHLSLVGAAALVPAGVLVYKARWFTAISTGLLVGVLIYPLVGNWVWGGGWLSNLGNSLALGHGFVDFGGAGVIFLSGSAVALMALIVFKEQTPRPNESGAEVVVMAGGERLTVYDDEGLDTPETESPLQFVPMPSAYLPILSMLGAGLLLLGWFGLSTGVHAPTAINFVPAQAAVNGLLAALSGALAAAAYSWFTTREVNPLMTARGLMAGLIVSVAAAPFASTGLFVVAGLVMGMLVPLLIYLFDQKLPLADGLGVLTTFGVSAVISLLLVGFFANGAAGQGWNGTGAEDYLDIAGQGVSGVLVAAGFGADWPGQLQAQLLGLGVVLAWSALLSFVFFHTVMAVAEAWARTGLEVVPPPAASEAPQVNAEESIDDQMDSQLTASH